MQYSLWCKIGHDFFLPLMRTLPRDGVGTHRDRVGPHICINFQLGGRLGPTETRPQGRAGHQGASPKICMIRKKNFFFITSPLRFLDLPTVLLGCSQMAERLPMALPDLKKTKIQLFAVCCMAHTHVQLYRDLLPRWVRNKKDSRDNTWNSQKFRNLRFLARIYQIASVRSWNFKS